MMAVMSGALARRGRVRLALSAFTALSVILTCSAAVAALLQARTADARAERHPVTLLTGSHHMQIYWYETGHDRSLGQLPFAYLKADRRWVPRNAIFLEPPVALQPAAEGRWNASCIACHTTLGQPRID